MNKLQSITRSKALQLVWNYHSNVNIYSTLCLSKKINLISQTDESRPLNRHASSVALMKGDAKPSLIKRIMRGLGLNSVHEGKLRLAGYDLCEQVIDKVDYRHWMKVNNLGDNFLSWFLITELHIWMILVRCMEESEDGRIARNSTIEALWADVAIRSIKYHPKSRSLVREQIQLLSQEFQAALVGYDEGLLTNDMVLAGALWRRFFLMSNDDPRLIENLVRHIRKQLRELDSIPKEKFLYKPDIKWLALSEKL